MVLALALDIKAICYCEILAQNEAINVARYVQFYKKLTDRWHGNQEPAIDDNARFHRYASVNLWIKKPSVQYWLHSAYSPPISLHDYGAIYALKVNKPIPSSVYLEKLSIEKLHMGTHMAGIWLYRSCHSARRISGMKESIFNTCWKFIILAQ